MSKKEYKICPICGEPLEYERISDVGDKCIDLHLIYCPKEDCDFYETY